MRVHLLTCGYTSARAGIARRGAGWATVRFPALVAAIEHPDGLVLFDTGYAPRVVEALRHGADQVYGWLLPVHVEPGEAVVAQLAALGLTAADVRAVVLSHLHADHVGGLADLPGTRVVTDARALAAARARRGLARVRTGFVPGLVPSGTDVVDVTGLPVVDEPALAGLGPVRDLLGDGRLLVVELPGHLDGHLGMLVRTGGRDLLLVGDAAWSTRTITHLELPHPALRGIVHDWPTYAATVRALHDVAARDPELVVLPSHDEDAIAAARVALA